MNQRMGVGHNISSGEPVPEDNRSAFNTSKDGRGKVQHLLCDFLAGVCLRAPNNLQELFDFVVPPDLGKFTWLSIR